MNANTKQTQAFPAIQVKERVEKDVRRDTLYLKALVRLAANRTGRLKYNEQQVKVLFREMESGMSRLWFSAFMIHNYLDRVLPNDPETDEEWRLKEIADAAYQIQRLTALGQGGDVDEQCQIIKEKLGVG